MKNENDTQELANAIRTITDGIKEVLSRCEKAARLITERLPALVQIRDKKISQDYPENINYALADRRDRMSGKEYRR